MKQPPLNPLDILVRLNWDEGDDLEFKSAKGGVPKSLWETYCAMANSHGGVILLGVENDGTVSGVSAPTRLKKSFWDTINNRGKVCCNLLTDNDLVEVPHKQGLILAIRVPQYHVDYREKLSSDPAIRWTDRLTVDGTWCANLFQFSLRAIQRLAQDLKLPFQLDGNLFRRGETVVHEAIREALVNTLIHADYQGQGGIVVEKYLDRFEFSNPGSLLISFDQLLRGNISECRNKALQTMFMMIGTAEKAGSGVDKIRRGWATQHWRIPAVREQVQPDRVQWLLPMISLIPEESLAKLTAAFGCRFARCSALEVQALVTADVENGVDNARMRQITGGHASDMTKTLQGLVEKKMLSQKGQGRWSRYRLPPAADSEHKGHDSEHKGGDSEQSIRLLRIAAPARSQQRLPPQQMEAIILDLCRNRWVTRNQLAELLARHPDGLRQRFLNPMVTHGLLRLRFPDKPNRTDQAYTANE